MLAAGSLRRRAEPRLRPAVASKELMARLMESMMTWMTPNGPRLMEIASVN